MSLLPVEQRPRPLVIYCCVTDHPKLTGSEKDTFIIYLVVSMGQGFGPILTGTPSPGPVTKGQSPSPPPGTTVSSEGSTKPTLSQAHMVAGRIQVLEAIGPWASVSSSLVGALLHQVKPLRRSWENRNASKWELEYFIT